jgi:ferric-dicitrate binding protein FerR (iron transport regulator)
MVKAGEIIRKCRLDKKMPLRIVAAFLNIDQAHLSRIERGERQLTKEQIEKLSEYFNISERELLIAWMADKVAEESIDEKISAKILKAATEKLENVEHSEKRSFERIEKTRKGNTYFLIGGIAAMVIVLFISALVIYSYNWQKYEYIEYVEEYTQKGSVKHVLLSDGSKITLKGGSTIFYPKKFVNKERKLYLNGEAAFEVTHNEKKPFIVVSHGVKVKVLGTVFNLSACNEDANMSTTLVSGKVQILFDNNKHNPVILKPNQQLTYNKSNDNYTVVNVANAENFTKRGLIFVNTGMRDMFNAIERHFGIEVNIGTNKFDNEIITAKFIHNENIKQTFDVLKRIIPNFNYKIYENKVFVY